MIVSLLVAMDNNNTIGYNGQLPWHLPADLAYFKKTTMGHVIVMGRKTYESIGRPLPGRHNVVMTTNLEYVAEGCTVVHSIEEVWTNFTDQDKIFIIGGADIFNLFLPFSDQLYITAIDHEFKGDTYFPEIDQELWNKKSSEPGLTNDKNPYTYTYDLYERK